MNYFEKYSDDKSHGDTQCLCVAHVSGVAYTQLKPRPINE